MRQLCREVDPSDTGGWRYSVGVGGSGLINTVQSCVNYLLT